MSDATPIDQTAPTEAAAPAQRSLGRVYIPNPGSQRYPLSAALPRSAFSGAASRSKTWQMGTKAKTLIGPHGPNHSSGRGWQSQSATSHCVRYGKAHILLLEPIVRLDAWSLTDGLYPWAQDNDYWPGSERVAPYYAGTSVDAGLQYLLHVAKVITSYHWPRSMDEVRARLTAPAKDGGGPLDCGSDWYRGMSNEAGAEATLRDPAKWEPSGEWWGGHDWIARGWKKATAKRSAKVLTGNSHIGNFEGEMDADAFEWLIFQQNGEAAAITERPK